MKKYKQFIGESVNFNENELKEKIISQGKWLILSKGLSMMNVIDNLLEQYKKPVSPEEIKTFNKGIDILRKTNFPNIDYVLSSRFPGGISNKKLVYVNGEWSYVNKLNTNYSDITDLLVHIIKLMLNDTNKAIQQYINPIYENIKIGNVKEGLLLLKPKIESIINHYFITNGNGLDEFLKFTNNIKRNSDKGEIAEEKACKYLINNGFTIEYQGGNGDFIDMLFGVDLITFREDIGYKTVQVKAFLPKRESMEYYKVDWFIIVDTDIKIIDRNTFQEVIIK